MSQSATELSNVCTFQRSKLTHHRILIVEDEMLIALALIDTVAALGASWTATSRVAKAVALVAAEPFDAAILDLNLAGEPADAVVEALRERDIPFVIATGYGPEAIAEKYRDLPRLSKPYTPGQVETALLGVLSAKTALARSA